MTSSEIIERYFADNYVDARQKFLKACTEKHLDVEPFLNNVDDNEDIELATDIIRIGKADASKLLILTSGVHGAELMCGSGCQVGLLAQDHFERLPSDTAVVMIHAINPWGAAHLRRNNEDNVDLCRNFVDFTAELPTNPEYERIHEALSSNYLHNNTNQAILDSMKADGEAAFVRALMSGQYKHEKGLSYGGSKAVWSHRLIKDILQNYAGSAEQVCLIDYHSGLGPFGQGTVVCMHEGDSLQRTKQWFGEDLMAPMSESKNGNEKFHPALGHTTEGYLDALPGRQITSIVLEYGTYDMASNLQALLDDHCLMLHGKPGDEFGQEIKQNMLRTHYPDDPLWRYAVWTRSEQVIEQAIRGLNGD